MEATPLEARVMVALSVSVPEMYAVVMVQVIVIPDAVLLYSVTTSPLENTELGISMDPPEPTPMYLPTSPDTSV
jgi:hypothetical protein